jgi:hypothetical protein
VARREYRNTASRRYRLRAPPASLPRFKNHSHENPGSFLFRSLRDSHRPPVIGDLRIMARYPGSQHTRTWILPDPRKIRNSIHRRPSRNRQDRAEQREANLCEGGNRPNHNSASTRRNSEAGVPSGGKRTSISITPIADWSHLRMRLWSSSGSRMAARPPQFSSGPQRPTRSVRGAGPVPRAPELFC